MEKKKFCQISFPVIDSALAAAAADERGRRSLSSIMSGKLTDWQTGRRRAKTGERDGNGENWKA